MKVQTKNNKTTAGDEQRKFRHRAPVGSISTLREFNLGFNYRVRDVTQMLVMVGSCPQPQARKGRGKSRCHREHERRAPQLQRTLRKMDCELGPGCIEWNWGFTAESEEEDVNWINTIISATNRQLFFTLQVLGTLWRMRGRRRKERQKWCRCQCSKICSLTWRQICNRWVS